MRFKVALFAMGTMAFAVLYGIQGVLPDVARDLGVSPAEASLAVSLATVGVAFGVLPWAWAGDRFGKFPALRLSAILTVVLGALAVFGPGFEWMLALRFLTGMALAGIPVLTVGYVHEIAAGWRSAAGFMAIYITATSIGGAGGRVLCAALGAELGWRGSSAVVAAGTALGLVGFLVFAQRPSQSRGTYQSQWHRLKRALSSFQLLRLYIHGMLITGPLVAMFSFISFRFEAAPFHFSTALISLVFLANFTGSVFAPLASILLNRWGYSRTTAAGFIGMTVGACLTIPDNLLLIIVGLCMFIGTLFFTHATAVATVGIKARDSFRSQASAMYTVSFYFGAGVGSLALGFFYETQGWTSMVVATSMLLLFGLSLLLIRTSETKRRTTETSTRSAAEDHTLRAPGSRGG